jgi:hypothetical protein
MNYENQESSPIYYTDGGVLHKGKWSLGGLLTLTRNDIPMKKLRAAYPGFNIVKAK